MDENCTQGAVVASTGYGSSIEHDYMRTTALDMAIRHLGTGAPVNRVMESAEAFYTFLTVKK